MDDGKGEDLEKDLLIMKATSDDAVLITVGTRNSSVVLEKADKHISYESEHGEVAKSVFYNLWQC